MTATVNLSSLDLAIVRRGVFVALYLCREQQKGTRTRFILLLGSPPPPTMSVSQVSKINQTLWWSEADIAYSSSLITPMWEMKTTWRTREVSIRSHFDVSLWDKRC